jgi:hypothetical protein
MKAVPAAASPTSVTTHRRIAEAEREGGELGDLVRMTYTARVLFCALNPGTCLAARSAVYTARSSRVKC